MGNPNLAIELVDDHIGFPLVPVPPLVGTCLDVAGGPSLFPSSVGLAGASRSPEYLSQTRFSEAWLRKKGMTT